MDRDIDARLARLERLESASTTSSRSSRQTRTFGSSAAGRNQCDAVCKAVGDKPARQCLNMTGKPAMHEGQGIFLCGTHMKASAAKLVTVYTAGPCTGTFSKDQGFVPHHHDARSYESPRASAPPTSPPPAPRRGLPSNVRTFADLGSSHVVHYHTAPQAAHQDDSDSDLDGVAEVAARLERPTTAAGVLERLERHATAAEARRRLDLSGTRGCCGLTQSGAFCKNNAGPDNMYCHLHVGQARRGAHVPPARTGCGAGGCHSTVLDKDSQRERYCRNAVGDHPTHCAKHR